MNRDDASLVAQMLEIATEGNWPAVREQMLERGWKPEEIVNSVGRLCKLAGVSPMVSLEDF